MRHSFRTTKKFLFFSRNKGGFSDLPAGSFDVVVRRGAPRGAAQAARQNWQGIGKRVQTQRADPQTSAVGDPSW